MCLVDDSEPLGSAGKLRLGTALNRLPFATGQRRSVESPSTAKRMRMLSRLVRLTISRVPTGRKRGGREEPRYLVSEVAKTGRLPWQPRLAYRPSSRPDASRLRIEARSEHRGPPPHGRESAESPLGYPPTAPRALSLFDSPLLRLAWLRPRPGAGRQRGRPLCEAAILTGRRHPLFTLPAVGIGAYLPIR